MREFTALLIVVVIAAACGSGSGGEPTGPTAPLPQLTVAQYLAEILDLELIALETTVDPPRDVRLLAGYNLELANRYRDALVAIDGFEAPVEANVHITAYRTHSELSRDVFSDAADAWLAGESIADLQTALLAVTSRAQDLATEFERLLLETLENAPDPLSAYLLASIGVRNEFSASYTLALDLLQPLIAAGDGTAIADALVAASSTLRSFLPMWDDLDPPVEATDAHNLQRDLIVDITDIFTDMAVPVAAEDGPATQEVALRMNGFVDDVGAANLIWNRLLAEALRSAAP